MSLKVVAQHLASKGRGEDTQLIHMTPGEVHGLQALAKAHGGSLTVNPDTGLPEAGFLKSILPTLVGLGANFFLPGIGMAGAAALGAGVGAVTNRDNPLMGALMGGLGAYGGASLGANIGAGLNAASTAAAAEGATAAGTTPMATANLETVSPEVWTGQPLPQPVAPPVAVTQPVAPTISEAAQVPAETEYWPAGAHTPPVKPTFGQSIEAALQKPGEFVKGAGGIGKLLTPAMMAAAPLTMMQPEITPRRRYSGEGGEYEYIPGYTGGEPSSSSYTGERRYFAPTYRKLAEGGEVTPAPQQLGYNPVVPQQAGIAGLSQAQQAPAFVASPGGRPQISDQEINQYVQNTLATPGMTAAQRAAQINATAYQYDVPRARLAAASGYDLPTANAYLSGIQNLPTSYGSTLPDTRGYGQMTGASADAMRYLYGMPGTSTAERVTQPITTASTSDIGVKVGQTPTQGGNYTDPNTGKTWTPEELAAGGYYQEYTTGGGDNSETARRWVPAPKVPTAPAPAPQSGITDAAIKNYISGILTDPSMSDAQRAAAINKAASENKVDRQRIAAATGYDIGTVNKYLDYVTPPAPWTGAPSPTPAPAPTAPTPAPKPAPAPAPSASGSWTPEEIAAGGKRVDVPWGDGGTMSRWIPYPGAAAPQPAPTPAPAPQTQQQYSTAEIKSYVDNILNDPSMTAAQRAAAINKAASQYGVSRARLAEATGYSPQQVEEYLGKAYAAGGGLRSGGFVVPADVVSALGNGSTDAGLEVLARKFNARAIDGPGDGMSDSIPTTIEGKQKARVARGEAYIAPEDVQKFGGSKKFYAMLDRIRHNAHGKKTQQRQVNPDTLTKTVRMAEGGDVKKKTTKQLAPIDEIKSEASKFPEYGAVMGYLAERKAVPQIQYSFTTPSLARGEFTSPSIFGDGDTPKEGIVTARHPSTLLHELTHAAQRQMELQYFDAAEKRKKQSLSPIEAQFMDAYEKLVYTPSKGFGSRPEAVQHKTAYALAPEWTNKASDYRSTGRELAAFGMGSTIARNEYNPAPLHVDPSYATEFGVLLDLAHRAQKGSK